MEITSSKEFTHKCVENSGKSVFITSRDDTSCELIKNLLLNTSNSNLMFFKAMGLEENIRDLIANAQLKNYKFKRNDAKRFLIRKFPEITCILDKNKTLIVQVLADWTSTIYERRLIVSFKQENLHEVEKIMDKSDFNDSFYKQLWPFVDIIIENVPDAPEHNSFVLSYKNDLSELLATILQNSVD